MKSIARVSRQLLPLLFVLVVSSIMFLLPVNGASPTINTGSFIAATSIHIQTGESYNGYLVNPDWTLGMGTGWRSYRVAVTFNPPFLVTPKVSLGLSGQDVAPGTNNRLFLKAEKITVNGFDIVYTTWADTIIYSLWATWTAIGG